MDRRLNKSFTGEDEREGLSEESHAKKATVGVGLSHIFIVGFDSMQLSRYELT